LNKTFLNREFNYDHQHEESNTNFFQKDSEGNTGSVLILKTKPN